ncbi:HDOD domain-containing protein [Thalassotalea montiporae]
MFNLDQQQIQSVMSSFQIPVKPEVLSEIENLMDEEYPDLGKISDVIARDVGLSAAILKVINSPFYGMNRRISEIKQAAMMLGLTTIKALVTALLLKKSFSGNASISLERFWDDAIDTANAMQFIGNRVKNEVPVDMLFTIGLFHDCGIPLLALKYDNYKDILIAANNNHENPIALEEKHYGCNHAVLGYYVATSWHLPKDICQLILRHHDFSFIKSATCGKEELVFCVLKAAENLTENVKRYGNSPDWQIISNQALSILGLSEEDYRDLMDDYTELYHEQ